ncbi:uncharacterized protein ajap1 [Antennarius striatus]|uniref:uncharacterized protein ajap1 n=1 Tax=Antennarius striatus TaxID=241820 RepID=UPI0035AF5528
MSLPPSLEETQEAIKWMKPNKASGPDNIPAELIQHGGDCLLKKIHLLFLSICKSKHVPQDLKDASIVPIFKKGDRSTCGNCRGISVFSITGKIFARILHKRLLDLSESVLPESQYGFRPGRGTTEMIFYARQLLEKAREQQQPMSMIFFDLYKAFDSVPCAALWGVLENFGCPQHYVQLVQGLHEGMRGSLGVRMRYRTDGGLFSLRCVKAQSKTSQMNISELQYDDDSCALASSLAELQESTDAFVEAYESAGLEVNVGKTKVLAQSHPAHPLQPFDISIHGNSVEQVRRFCYLGSVLNNTNDPSEDINNRIRAAHQAFGKLYHRVFSLHGLSAQTKIDVYRAVVIPTLLYGPFALRPGSCVGHRVWILLAMTHLTLDFSMCSPLSQGLGIKITAKSLPRSRPRWQSLWDMPTKLHWRPVSPFARRLLNPIPPTQDNKVGIGPNFKGKKHRRPMHKGQVLCQECQLRYSKVETDDPLDVIPEAPVALSRRSRRDAGWLLLRARRQLKWDTYDQSQEGRTTTVSGFIDWGPTGTDSIDEDGKLEPNMTLSTRLSTPTVATTTSTTTRLSQRTFTVVTTPQPKRLSTTKSTISFGETVKPPKPYGDTPVLAVHQIITITVSLIMVIAALITTLVLKNCCAQSGNGRHNSHQRKIHQQEESCQNLTDFTPARVPSKVDIFTAYNDSLQCSHECVRTAVPIYTDEMIQQTPLYKTAYNGNRPSPTERQLIPVAFVSEKWFEISC